MATWAGIVRVSHMGDRKVGADDFHADREQVEAIKRGVPRGDELDLLPPELDTSGGLPLAQRPSLTTAIEGVESGRYVGIVVGYLSRLGRRMDLLNVWDRVEAAGGRIVAVQEGIDTSTPAGRHMRNLMLSQATMERELHVERFDNLKRWATEAGVWQRRQTPRGYSRDPQTRRLVPNDDAPQVVWAFERRAAGATIREIANGLAMTGTGTRNLLRNRVYLGELSVGQYTNSAAHPALVTREQFEAAQEGHPRPPRSELPPAMLIGIVFCDGCGRRMTRNNGGHCAPRYTCNGDRKGGRCPSRATIACHLLDAHVEPHGRAIMDALEATSHTLDVDSLRREAEDADAETAAFVEHVSARTPGYAQGLAKREQDAQARWAKYRAAVPQNGVQGLSWDDMTPGERNRVLRGAGLRVVVARSGAPFGHGVPLAERVTVATNADGPALVGVAGA